MTKTNEIFVTEFKDQIVRSDLANSGGNDKYSVKKCYFYIFEYLNVILNVFALTRVKRENGGDVVPFNVNIRGSLYCLIVIAAGSLSIYYRWIYVYIHMTTTTFVSDLATLIISLICSVGIIISNINRKKDSVILLYRNVSEIDKRLSINCSSFYDEQRSVVIKSLKIFTISITILFMIDFAVWYYINDYIHSVVYACNYIFISLSILASLELSLHIRLVRNRFELMRHILMYKATDYFDSSTYKSLNIEHSFCSSLERWTDFDESILSQAKLNLKTCTIDLTTLQECYLKANDQIVLLNILFGPQMIFVGFSSMVNMTLYSYITLSLAMGKSEMLSNGEFLPFVALFNLVSLYAVTITVTASAAEFASRARNRLRTLINKLQIVDSENPDFEDIRKFQNIMETSSGSITLEGFLEINYKYLLAFMGTITTYLVIMAQIH